MSAKKPSGIANVEEDELAADALEVAVGTLRFLLFLDPGPGISGTLAAVARRRKAAGRGERVSERALEPLKPVPLSRSAISPVDRRSM